MTAEIGSFEGKADYWNAYYRSGSVPDLPSQFAVFMLGEMAPGCVVDIGCGAGRDSFFFAGRGIPTLGLDASDAAVALCRRKATERALDKIRFDQLDIGAAGAVDALCAPLDALAAAGPLLIYARFFVHAINHAEEASLFTLASALLRDRPGALAVEFRTTRDTALEKVTPSHYRRFVDPAAFLQHAAQHGLVSCYAVEGFGMAKYRQDDAYVARIILAPADGAEEGATG